MTQKTGTIGSPGALFTVNYNSSVPQKIYYSLEKSGFISTSDTTVKIILKFYMLIVFMVEVIVYLELDLQLQLHLI